MKKQKRTAVVYIAEDGKEFLSEAACEAYEKNTIGRLKNIKYFVVTHNPDLTEGRGYYGLTKIAVESQWSHSLYVEMFCEKAFGSRVAFVMGVSPMTNWSFREVTREQFDGDLKTHVGDYSHKPKETIFFSSNSEAIEGLPEPQPYPKEKA